MSGKDNRVTSKGKGGLLWFVAPLAICVPCLLPLIAGGLLAGIGVGAVGSFFINNALWLAIVASIVALFTLLVGWRVSRLRQRAGAVRFLSRDG